MSITLAVGFAAPGITLPAIVATANHYWIDAEVASPWSWQQPR